jgi:hypothetical protein
MWFFNKKTSDIIYWVYYDEDEQCADITIVHNQTEYKLFYKCIGNNTLELIKSRSTIPEKLYIKSIGILHVHPLPSDELANMYYFSYIELDNKMNRWLSFINDKAIYPETCTIAFPANRDYVINIKNNMFIVR